METLNFLFCAIFVVIFHFPFHWHIFQNRPHYLYTTKFLCQCWSLMMSILTACVVTLSCLANSTVDICFCITCQNTAKVSKTVHITNVLPAVSDCLQYFDFSNLHYFCFVGTDSKSKLPASVSRFVVMSCKVPLVSAHKLMSSAKSRSVNRDWLVYYMPRLMPFMVCCTTMSIIRKNGKGDSIHPWQTPLMTLKNSVRSLLVLTQQLEFRNQVRSVVITKLIPAVNAATNSFHRLLSSAISWSDIHYLPVVMPYLEIPALCKSSSTQSIQRFFGLPHDRLLLGSHLNTCFTVLLSDIGWMCPVHPHSSNPIASDISSWKSQHNVQAFHTVWQYSTVIVCVYSRMLSWSWWSLLVVAARIQCTVQ